MTMFGTSTRARVVRDILDAYDQRQRVLLLHGRSLHDLDAASRPDGSLAMRPLIEELTDRLRSEVGVHLITFRLSTGVDWNEVSVLDGEDAATIRTLLRVSGLPDQPIEEVEREAMDRSRGRSSPNGQTPQYPDTVQIVRGLVRLLTTSMDHLTWSDGMPRRVGVLVEFSEDIAPGSAQFSPTDAQLAVAEMVALLASDLAMLKSGNLLLLHGRLGLMNELVAQSAPQLRLLQPAREGKAVFIEALRGRYPNVELEPGLSWEEVANITARTPNAGLEAQAFAAQRRGRPLTARALVEQKMLDVSAMSEGTLSLLDPTPVSMHQLVGRNIRTAAQVVEGFADALASGDDNTPMNVLLAGPHGVGKSVLARIAAQKAKAPAFRMNSSKRGIVGETERVTRLMLDTVYEFAPTICFVDEITEQLPVSTIQFNGDSGASQSVQGALLEALADESRRGKVLTLACTNHAFAMEDRMRDRFLVLPVLSPLAEDLPEVILSLSRRVSHDPDLDIDVSTLGEAARIFSSKGVNPRTIGEKLSRACLGKKKLTADAVLTAARSCPPEWDRTTAILGELWAIAHASDNNFLPWFDDPAGYAFPDHITNVVDHKTGEIDRDALRAELKKYGWADEAGA